MDRYRKVQKAKAEGSTNENEIRITSQGFVRNYISYATNLLQENDGREIVLKAMGPAINKAVAITEIIKRRIPQLHQDTVISSVNIVDVYEPIEEGLLPVETSRNVSMISITLSTKELNKNSPGYQAPATAEQVQQQQQSRKQRTYQQQQPPRQHNNQHRRQNNYQQQQTSNSYGRGRGGSRGRGRGRGEGDGGARGGGRGRGYGRSRGTGRMGSYARDDSYQRYNGIGSYGRSFLSCTYRR
ncbi:hypothetical protein DCAR_0314318 [Daucus carota subsp. sativus]|uniref:DNA/RNA-binding protein Alba-like domain-containing protein n=1 Tax=Daucus carota subsp. sativus TaxID=79200 RepID=A0AAF0WTW9_DAUCS|nr:hypothetical protein DCAR_0314318 [Daucus carota subsp. sativus]